jgi:S-DNA-T family DNA segregation ATPase FtsK/SpoIIIE
MTDVELNGHAPPAVPGFLVPRDTSFEHLLDEDIADPVPVHEGDGNEIPPLGGQRKPVVPEHLRTPRGVWTVACKYLDAAGFHLSFHALRSPRYLGLGVVWAVAGICRIAHDQCTWWWVTESSGLRSKAVVDGNSPEWRSLHSHVIKRRSYRGAVLGFEVFTVALTLVLIAAYAPWQAWFIVAAVAMPPLAHHGHPDNMPIVQSAVTTPLVRKISTDVIVRAYTAAGLASTDPRSQPTTSGSAPS